MPEPIIPSTVTFQFQNVVDGVDVVLNEKEYTNPLGQTYTISAWKYFVSNIQFLQRRSFSIRRKRQLSLY